MNSELLIRLLDWNEALPLARPIRERVFIEEQRVPRELEWDDRDARSVHALAFAGGLHAIGTARLLPDGRIGRMAVLREWRGRGVGTALALALIRRAAENGFEEVVLNAQLHAEPFYRRLGFIPRGPVFQEAGIDHVEMTLPCRASFLPAKS
jgi:predicted GNAT family N-acyltransferase